MALSILIHIFSSIFELYSSVLQVKPTFIIIFLIEIYLKLKNICHLKLYCFQQTMHAVILRIIFTSVGIKLACYRTDLDGYCSFSSSGLFDPNDHAEFLASKSLILGWLKKQW